MLIGQVGQDRKINTIFGKRLRVLGHSKLLKPIRHSLLHWRSPSGIRPVAPGFVVPRQDARRTTIALPSGCGRTKVCGGLSGSLRVTLLVTTLEAPRLFAAPMPRGDPGWPDASTGPRPERW